MSMDTLNPINLDRYVDGPDALPQGEHTQQGLGAIGVRVTDADTTEVLRSMELYRMRTQPHLYDQWMRDLIEDARMAAVDTVGTVYDWDCHGCKRAVLTPRITDACPNCGRR